MISLWFAVGGTGYVLLELLWRRRSHVSMFIAGGVCFLLLIWLSQQGLTLWMAAIAAGIGITAVEFAVGCVVNLWLKLNVWDYSCRKYNVLGQICLLYTVLWCGLGGLTIAAAQWIS